MTDTLRLLGMGKVPKARFIEMLEPTEDKSAEQLVGDFLAKYQALGGEE